MKGIQIDAYTIFVGDSIWCSRFRRALSEIGRQRDGYGLQCGTDGEVRVIDPYGAFRIMLVCYSAQIPPDPPGEPGVG
jgi:hypothetical protein